jgi:hypothetical protein
MSRKILDDKKAKNIVITMSPEIIKRVDEARGNNFSRSTWLKIAALNEMRRQKEGVLQGSRIDSPASQATSSVINGGGSTINDA